MYRYILYFIIYVFFSLVVSSMIGFFWRRPHPIQINVLKAVRQFIMRLRKKIFLIFAIIFGSYEFLDVKSVVLVGAIIA